MSLSIAGFGVGDLQNADPTPAPTNPAQFGAFHSPGSAVFAPGTTPEQMVAAYQNLLATNGIGLEHMIGGAGLELQPSNSRWNSTRGTPVDITYSFTPDGTSTSQGSSSIFATLDAALGSTTLWQQRYQQALDAWAAVTANTYTKDVDDGATWNTLGGVPGVRGELRLTAGPIDGPSGVLAFNFFPNSGDMLIDSQDSGFWGNSSNGNRFLRNVVTHENGHGMGLFHECPTSNTAIMEPFINTNFDGPQFDDILSMQYQYGDPQEPNGAIGNAASLDGLGLTSGVPLQVPLLSLHANNDFDLFAINAVAGSVLNSVIAAVDGSTYLAGAQNSNGSCQPGTSFNARQQFDLILEVLDPTGTVIATSNATGLGGGEQLSGIALPTTGTFFIRVRPGTTTGTTGAFHIQPYNLSVTATLTPVAGDINGDGNVNGIDLSLVLNQFGGPGSADLNNDGVVDGGDLAIVLNGWTG